ncbi:MAG: hypothetical protein R3D67_12635 [Hyphomicrobiaceae bacterium]
MLKTVFAATLSVSILWASGTALAASGWSHQTDAAPKPRLDDNMRLAQFNSGGRQRGSSNQNAGQTRRIVRDGCVWLQIVKNGRVREIKISCQQQGAQQGRRRSRR